MWFLKEALVLFLCFYEAIKALRTHMLDKHCVTEMSPVLRIMIKKPIRGRILLSELKVGRSLSSLNP